MSIYANPAQSLEGVLLGNGWKVGEIIKKKPQDTGGHFSVSYIAERQGEKAFLKALDFTSAFQAPDMMTALNDLTTAFLFERDLLYKCKSNHLSKIVTPLDHGQYRFEGEPDTLSVYYIIFDLAQSDLRRQISSMQHFDLAWILRSLHHTAVGMQQLHSSGIAHQDLKPSNVLVYREDSKIGDLGRSSDINKQGPNDKFKIPGDRNYSPFELMYNVNAMNFSQRFAADLYSLGSLIFYYFLRINLTQILWTHIVNNNQRRNLTWRDYSVDLPIYQEAFRNAVASLEAEINRYSTTLCAELIPITIMLCDPNPATRGYFQKSTGNQYSLERFISKFDQIAKKAEYRLYEHNN